MSGPGTVAGATGVGPSGPDGTSTPGTARGGRAVLAGSLALDLVLPLALFYGLRLAGADPWLALVLSALTPLVRVAARLWRHRRVDRVALFTLSLMGVGTGIGLVTADARLLLARESYVTAVVGLWILATHLGRHPLVFTATLRLMPTAEAEAWQRRWPEDPGFRRLLATLNAAFGVAFLVDAAARVVMAYTLPVDLVPLLSALLLVAMLVAVVQVGRAYGRQHLGPRRPPP